MSEILNFIAEEAGYIILGVLVLVLSRLIKDYITPFRINEELTTKDNPALGLSITGYYLAVTAIYIGSVYDNGTIQQETDFGSSLLVSFGYTLLGILLLNAGRKLLDKIILYKFDTLKEIIEDRNSGTGAVVFANYLATGLILSGAVSGEGGGILTMLAFFILGQSILMIYTFIYQKILPYDIHEAIEQDNIAAGVALGGNMIAAGIIMLKGIAGDFTGWTENLTLFIGYSITGIPLLLLFRLIIDIFLLPGASLAKEINEDKNLNAGYIEGALLIALSTIIFFTT